MLMEEKAALLARIGMLEDIAKALVEQKDAALLQNDEMRSALETLDKVLAVAHDGAKILAMRSIVKHGLRSTETPKCACQTPPIACGGASGCYCGCHAVTEKRIDAKQERVGWCPGCGGLAHAGECETR
jgi:hypothetical protein